VTCEKEGRMRPFFLCDKEWFSRRPISSYETRKVHRPSTLSRTLENYVASGKGGTDGKSTVIHATIVTFRSWNATYREKSPRVFSRTIVHIYGRRRNVGRKKELSTKFARFSLMVSCGDSAPGQGNKSASSFLPPFRIYICCVIASVSHAASGTLGHSNAEFHITSRQNTFPLLLLYEMILIFCDGRVYFNNIFCKRKECVHA